MQRTKASLRTPNQSAEGRTFLRGRAKFSATSHTLYLMASSSSKSGTRGANVRTAKPRTPSGAIGGFIGAVIMSVIAGVLVTVAVTPVVALSGYAASSAISVFENLPGHLDPGQLAEPSSILAVNSAGETVKLADFFAQNREMVGWDQISQYVKDAAVSVEDPRFFTHNGVDVFGLGRAVLGQLKGGDAGGASTITMQYVRNVLVQQAEAIIDEDERDAAYKDAMEKTTERKLQEIRYAVSIEKKYSKDEILLGYLNIALFGKNIYGIESAAQSYYGKPAKDLTLSEAASLVAIVQFPSNLNLSDPENIPDNQVRRDLVLQRMLDAKRITQAQYDEAVATDVVPNYTIRQSGCVVAENNFGLGHFCDYVQRYIELDPAFGNTAQERHFNFLRGGYQIMTTINLDMQAQTLEAIRSEVPQLMEGIAIGAAASSVQAGTGRVLLMAQNRPFSADQDFLDANPGYTSINYNTDFEYGGSSGFQVGSTMKVFTLAEWLRAGNSLFDSVNGNGRTVNLNTFKAACLGGVYGSGNFTFKNDARETPGNTTVMNGAAQSLNGVFVSMQQRLDLCNTVQLAESLGVHRAIEMPENSGTSNAGTRNLTVVPSLAFAGTDEIAPLTMAAANAAFAGNGVFCTPVPIDSITDANGVEVNFTKSKCAEAISPDVAAGVLYALEGVVRNGTMAHSRSNYGVPHFGKSGTTDEVVDRWNTGGSSTVATAVWTGNTEGKVSLLRAGLGRPERIIYNAAMNAADAIYGGSAFPTPPRNATERTMVAVPDVSGKSYAEAEQILTAAGFAVINGGEVDSTVAAGLVASTNPAGEAGRGSGITVYVSNGSQKVIPGGLVGQSGSSAKQALSNASFTNVTFECSPNPPPGPTDSPTPSKIVESVNPGEGQPASPNNQVTLFLKCVP